LAGDGTLTSEELGANAVVEVNELGVLDEACSEVDTADLSVRGVATLFVFGVFLGAASNSFS
jgi:hypothetical protein